MQNLKNEIRTEIARKRRYLTEFQKRKLDNTIITRLKSSDEWKKAKNVLVYVSHKNEIDTAELIKSFIAKKNIVVPKTHLKFNVLSLHQIDSVLDLVKGRYNLLEPHPNTTIVKPADIDLAIIPGIAFDKKGYRIGYGKGYYDRLSRHLECPKISLAYSFQIVDNVPAQAHDIPVDIIITENETISAKT